MHFLQIPKILGAQAWAEGGSREGGYCEALSMMPLYCIHTYICRHLERVFGYHISQIYIEMKASKHLGLCYAFCSSRQHSQLWHAIPEGLKPHEGKRSCGSLGILLQPLANVVQSTGLLLRNVVRATIVGVYIPQKQVSEVEQLH